MRLIWVSSLAFGLMGCTGGALRTVRDQAAKDMPCPMAQVKVTSTVNAQPDYDLGGAYYAEGCHQIRRYTTWCNGVGCHDVEGFDVLPLVQKQASFDMRCDAGTLAIERLSIDTFGVRGCERQASYQIVCEFGSCHLTQNSQLQHTDAPAPPPMQ